MAKMHLPGDTMFTTLLEALRSFEEDISFAQVWTPVRDAMEHDSAEPSEAPPALTVAGLPYSVSNWARSVFDPFREKCEEAVVSSRSGFLGKAFRSGAIQISQALSVVSSHNHPRNKLTIREDDDEAHSEYLCLPLHRPSAAGAAEAARVLAILEVFVSPFSSVGVPSVIAAVSHITSRLGLSLSPVEHPHSPLHGSHSLPSHLEGRAAVEDTATAPWATPGPAPNPAGPAASMGLGLGLTAAHLRATYPSLSAMDVSTSDAASPEAPHVAHATYPQLSADPYGAAAAALALGFLTAGPPPHHGGNLGQAQAHGQAAVFSAQHQLAMGMGMGGMGLGYGGPAFPMPGGQGLQGLQGPTWPPMPAPAPVMVQGGRGMHTWSPYPMGAFPQ